MKPDSLSRVTAECVWELTRFPEALDSGIRDELRELIDDLKGNGVVVAPTLAPFSSETAVRPEVHNRAFYMPLPAVEGRGQRGYVAVKGSEFALDGMLKELADTGVILAWSAKKAAIDVFPIEEHKAPLALTMQEAMDEVTISEEIVHKYTERYNEVPYLPLPLAVFRWPKDVVDRYMAVLRPLLSPFALQIVERLLATGAGCYLYYYPRAPFPRVRHIADQLTESGPERLETLAAAAATPADEVVARWVQEFTRMLALGYLASTPSQMIVGQAVQEQNTVAGGGFVDLDSVRSISDIVHERDFFESYALSIGTLSSTVARYLFTEVGGEATRESAETFSFLYLYELVAAAVARDIAEFGDAFDPKLKRLPPFAKDLRSLIALVETYQRMPQPWMLTKFIAARPEENPL